MSFILLCTLLFIQRIRNFRLFGVVYMDAYLDFSRRAQAGERWEKR